MKKIYLSIVCAILSLGMFAQESTGNLKDFKSDYYKNFSKVSGSVYATMPLIFGGDFISLTADKFHLGYGAGVKFGYQITPIVGLSLSGQYSQNKAGARDIERPMSIMTNGQVSYGFPEFAPAGSKDLKSLSANIAHMAAGLHLDINLAAIFNGGENRGYALVISPAVYAQKFSPVVNNAGDGSRFTTSDLPNPISLGFGGDIDLRIKATSSIDFLVKAGGAWIRNSNFDGIDMVGTENLYAHIKQVGIGLVFNFGANDNLIYAATSGHVKKMFNEADAARLEAERIAREKAEAERLAREAEEAARAKAEADRLAAEKAAAERSAALLENTLPELPLIHFTRGSARIDMKKYSSELQTIVDVLTEKSAISVEIVGYCDHTGSDAHNEILSKRRAESLKKYLMGKGISESRLETKGMGKDPVLTGKDALSIKARRVEVRK